MVELKSCPICNEENIQIQYDNRTIQFKMYCSSWDKVYYLSKKVKIKCSECESIDIRFDDYTTCCSEFGLVLAETMAIALMTVLIFYQAQPELFTTFLGALITAYTISHLLDNVVSNVIPNEQRSSDESEE